MDSFMPEILAVGFGGYSSINVLVCVCVCRIRVTAFREVISKQEHDTLRFTLWQIL